LADALRIPICGSQLSGSLRKLERLQSSCRAISATSATDAGWTPAVVSRTSVAHRTQCTGAKARVLDEVAPGMIRGAGLALTQDGKDQNSEQYPWGNMIAFVSG
jgi:hypothetical protein